MEITLRQTINNIMREHLSKGYLAFGQCLTAVGWVNGTIPELNEECGLVELPMSDVSNSGIVVGSALMGKRPIYVVRYQGFQWFNSIFLANYAAKSKEVWQTPCPVFVRSLAMEGGIGPTASSSHHGIFMRTPGTKIVAPMTPNEFKEVYNDFMAGDDPMYVSEHRKSFDNTKDFEDIVVSEGADISIFAFSITRMEMKKVYEMLKERGITANIFHHYWLRPSKVPTSQIIALRNSKYTGLVLDDEFVNGFAKQMAYDLMLQSGRVVCVMGLEDRTAGATPHLDNLPPSADKIVMYIEHIITNIKDIRNES